MENASMKRLVPLAFTCLLIASSAHADIKPAKPFTNHMVLQRAMAVPVFGTADPLEEVTVAFRGQTKKTTAGADGQWRVTLDPLKAGGPDTMTISGSNTVTLEDVLVGEVWVGSGQSNMAGGAGRYANGDEVLAKWIAGGPYPKLRLLGSRDKGWGVATPENAGRFSAILFAFGLELQRELDVPVGLYVGAVGGTPSGRWVPADALLGSAECERLYNEGVKANPPEKRLKQYEAKLAAWERAAAAAEKAGKKPRGRKPKKPAPPPAFKDLKPGGLFESHIRQFVGYGIRGVLWDQGESGTMFPEIDQFTMMGVLIGGWRELWGQGEFPWIHVQKPSGGGCAWGLKDDPTTRMADAFRPLPATINPKDNGLYRELHTRIMRHPRTFMAIARDLGSGVHPRNKSGYGTRAASVALAEVYGKDIVCYGPMYKSHKVEGKTIRVSFHAAGKGLAFRHADKLQGFSIAGEDRVFHWADAVIDGDTVVVSCADVPSPVAVRYAWARNAPWANLFNKDSLPAPAFRTDDW
jgi:sialate O-acetylesterase